MSNVYILIIDNNRVVVNTVYLQVSLSRTSRVRYK